MDILDLIGNISNIAGFVGAFFSVAIWVKMKLDEKKANEEINVFLELYNGDSLKTLPLSMLRKDISRAEILGRLGMLPMGEKGKRFSIRYLADNSFIGNINDITKNKTNKLIILVNNDELNQFDWNKIR